MTDEELLLGIIQSLGGQAPRKKIKQAVEARAWDDTTYTVLNVDFDRVILGLLAVQDITIMPDGDYQFWERATA